MNPVRKNPGKILTPRLNNANEQHSPTPYPKKLVTFSKLFWQTNQNVSVEVSRLSPAVFPDTLGVVFINLDTGDEINRLYFDQMLLELLLRPTLEALEKKEVPAKFNAPTPTPAPALLGRQPNCLDNQSEVLKRFFDNKAHMVDGVVKIRGLTTIELPENVNDFDLPQVRTKAMSFGSFDRMHKDLKENVSASSSSCCMCCSLLTVYVVVLRCFALRCVAFLHGRAMQMESVRRATLTAESAVTATAKAMATVTMFNNLMNDHKKRTECSKLWSLPKKRWKKAIGRVTTNLAIERTRRRLNSLGYNV